MRQGFGFFNAIRGNATTDVQLGAFQRGGIVTSMGSREGGWEGGRGRALTSEGVLDCGSRTTSRRRITLGPPARFCRILISRLICYIVTHIPEGEEWVRRGERGRRGMRDRGERVRADNSSVLPTFRFPYCYFQFKLSLFISDYA
jgi:hypothetical protein